MGLVRIGGIKEASTIDYPGEMVSVIFFCRCPFKCPFCQNWGLVKGEDCYSSSIEDIIKEISKFRKYITGICVTGGEPTVQIKGLNKLLKETHQLGLLNKLDTNGFYSDRIQQLLADKLIDYAAIDIKAPLNPERYGEVIGSPSIGEEAVKNVIETIHNLEKCSIPFETRTTIVPGYNDSEEEIELVAQQLKERKVTLYVLQQFRATGGTLDENFSNLPITNPVVLNKLAKIAKYFIPDVRIRTLEAGEEKV